VPSPAVKVYSLYSEIVTGFFPITIENETAKWRVCSHRRRAREHCRHCPDRKDYCSELEPWSRGHLSTLYPHEPLERPHFEEFIGYHFRLDQPSPLPVKGHLVHALGFEPFFLAQACTNFASFRINPAEFGFVPARIAWMAAMGGERAGFRASCQASLWPRRSGRIYESELCRS